MCGHLGNPATRGKHSSRLIGHRGCGACYTSVCMQVCVSVHWRAANNKANALMRYLLVIPRAALGHLLAIYHPANIQNSQVKLSVRHTAMRACIKALSLPRRIHWRKLFFNKLWWSKILACCEQTQAPRLMCTLVIFGQYFLRDARGAVLDEIFDWSDKGLNFNWMDTARMDLLKWVMSWDKLYIGIFF